MVAEKAVPEHFGKAMINAVSGFARTGIADAEKLDTKWFEHIKDDNVRSAICDTFHGARWIYKVGLALLVEDKEQFAHVRAQVIDYGSICETMLSEMISHGLQKNKFKGRQFEHKFPSGNAKIQWSRFGDLSAAVRGQKFWWHIAVAKEEKIINSVLVTELEALRKVRNTVHLTEKINSNTTYHLGMSARALETLHKTINQTKAWYNRNK
ncbi:hypothetical protein [Thermomonas sp.]|uniref:hypothetical protein n=1 Tax=Thermomonas sp. TaxID=1971895 RepID=UPI00391A168F